MATKTAAAAPTRAKLRNLREHILNKVDREEELVHVPGWDEPDAECWILVRSLTGAERAKFQRQATVQEGGVQKINWDRFWPDLVILASYDPEDGQPIFEKSDRDALLLKNSKNLETVAAVARRLSGLDENALANAKSETEDD